MLKLRHFVVMDVRTPEEKQADLDRVEPRGIPKAFQGKSQATIQASPAPKKHKFGKK